jgi:hypothetical protein
MCKGCAEATRRMMMEMDERLRALEAKALAEALISKEG